MTRVFGAVLSGVDGVPVEVEVRISSLLPRVDVVGLPEAAVRESAARVRAAVSAAGHRFPERRVTVNLAPASLRKSGAGLDLPIAIGVLVAAGSLESERLTALGLVGELALDGRLVRCAAPWRSPSRCATTAASASSFRARMRARRRSPRDSTCSPPTTSSP